MPKTKRGGFTLDLGLRLYAELVALEATYYRKTKHDILREALIAHIEEALKDRERRLRFNQNLASGRTRRRPRIDR